MVCRGDTDARDDDSDLGVNEDDLIFARWDPCYFLQSKPQQLKLTASSTSMTLHNSVLWQ